MRVLRVTFRGKSVKEFAAHYHTDLSPTGIFIRTRQPLPIGTKLRFELRLENEQPLLFGQGVVVWVSEENVELGLNAGMELRFESLNAESQLALEWLLLEKRGVTVGTEVPHYVATSTASDPANGSAPEPEAAARRSPTGPERAIPEAALAPAAPRKSPTGPERAIAETSPALAPADEDSGPRAADDAAGRPDPRATLPYGERLPALRPQPAHGALLAVPYRPPALGGADSDPERMFHAVRASSPGFPRVGASSAPAIARPSRGPRIVLGMMLGVVALAAAAYLLVRGSRPPPPSAPTWQTGVVQLESVPPRAEVLVEGRLAGQTPLALTLPDESMIQVRLDGYLPEVIKVSALDPRWLEQDGRRTLRLSVSLQRLRGVEPERAAPAPAPLVAAGPRRGKGAPAVRERARTTKRARQSRAREADEARPPATQPAAAPKAEPGPKPPAKPAVGDAAEGKPAATKVKAPGWSD